MRLPRRGKANGVVATVRRKAGTAAEPAVGSAAVTRDTAAAVPAGAAGGGGAGAPQKPAMDSPPDPARRHHRRRPPVRVLRRHRDADPYHHADPYDYADPYHHTHTDRDILARMLCVRKPVRRYGTVPVYCPK